MPRICLFVLSLCVAFISGCGNGPPGSAVTKAVSDAAMKGNTLVFDASDTAVELTGLSIGDWREDKEAGELRSLMTGGRGGSGGALMTTWTGKLTFKEPIVHIVAEARGKTIVKVVAPKGSSLDVKGSVSAILDPKGEWSIHARTGEGKGLFSMSMLNQDAGVFQPWVKMVEPVMNAYPVLGSIDGQRFRKGPWFVPLSRVNNAVIDGSEEAKAMYAELNAEIQAEAARRAAEEQRRKDEFEARRKAQADADRRAQEEAEAKRQAQIDERKRLADEAVKARQLPMVKPFKLKGLLMGTPDGLHLGQVFTTMEVDEQAMTVKGSGLDLRSLPVKDFTFEGSVNDRGILTLKLSHEEKPLVYSKINQGRVEGGTNVPPLVGMSAEGMAAVQDYVSTLRTLNSAEAKVLDAKTFPQAEAIAREKTIKTTPMTGLTLFRNRLDANAGRLFAADLARNDQWGWGQESISIRLKEPVKGSALYIRGGTRDSASMTIVINGTHRAQITGIPKLGGAIIDLPADLPIIDLRIDGLGQISSRGVMLVN